MRILIAGALLTLSLSGCAANTVWWTPTQDPSLRVEVRERGKRACVNVGPRLDGCFDAVAMRSLALSTDGHHVAYPAKVQGRWAVVRDGIAGPTWDGIASLAFSDDGRHLGYAAMDGDRWRVVIDGRPGELHGSLIAGIGPIGFSPDGSRFAYAAHAGNRTALVVDGVALTPHDAISEFVFSSDGGHLSYAARDGAEWFVIEGATTSGPYESIRSLAYRPMTESLTYVARGKSGERVVSGGVAGPEYETVGTPMFSRDGGNWGYLARSANESVVVLNGVVRAKETWIRGLAISPGGDRLAYIAERGGAGFVVDEKGDHPFDLLIEESLVFVRDGHAWACLAGDRQAQRLYVAVEGTSRRRAFDWDEAARRLRRSAEPGFSAEQTRSWIRAQAERILAEDSPHKPRP